MKRKLDDIELEEIEHFHIDQTTLIIRTKTEEISYSYSNSLEMLRRIRYLLHRYEVEYNRKENRNMNIDNNIKNESQNRINRNKEIIFKLILLFIMFGPLIAISLPSIYWHIVSLMFIANFSLHFSNIKEAHIIEMEKKKSQEIQKQNESQIDKGYESLKEVSISYLNKITKTFTNIGEDEKYYIEVIEKGFQKRIGTYPQQ